MFPEQVGGFTVVPVALNNDKKSPVYHVIYLKKHDVPRHSEEDPDIDISERTVYAVNIPSSATFDNIKSMCRDIADVIVEDFRPEVGNRAQIILIDKASCNRLLSKAKSLHKLEKKPITWIGVKSAPTGYQKYVDHALKMFPDPDNLLIEVNKFMKAYNENEQREKLSRRSKQGLVDEDGFILVTSDARGSKASIAAQAAETQERLKKELEKKSKKREMPDFYRFQIREKKKKATNDLLKKFNDDKAKILEMREKNRFRPY